MYVSVCLYVCLVGLYDGEFWRRTLGPDSENPKRNPNPVINLKKIPPSFFLCVIPDEVDAPSLVR